MKNPGGANLAPQILTRYACAMNCRLLFYPVWADYLLRFGLETVELTQGLMATRNNS